MILAHVALALLYTTPWDNYLVASGVWWYDPALVTGIRLGWVPLEEYIFFVLQTLLTGLWYLALARRIPPRRSGGVDNPRLRLTASLIVLALWVFFTAMLFSGWQPGTYLGLILAWGLAPVWLQMTFGGDILAANWRAVGLTILAPTAYLWWVDALAISSGTWSIDPAQTTGIMLGPLPFEEMIFFLMTNVIIAFGMALMLAPESQPCARAWLARRKPAVDSVRRHGEQPVSDGRGRQ